MDIENVYKEIKGINLPEKDKEAFVRLIKIKTDADMKEVINAISSLKQEINAFDHKLETSIGALRGEIGYIKWFIGGGIALATLIMKFLK